MSPLEEMILAEIRGKGAMTFARFMSLALYHPEHGYYATANSVVRVGARGDFFTAVSVGAVFGRILARQVARWWAAEGSPSPFDVVEWGAHDGQLALDLLAALERDAPRCFAATRYAIVEPLAKMQETQRRRLEDGKKVRWVRDAQDLGRVCGVILANELLDSLPFRIYERADKEVELGVGVEGEALRWQALGLANGAAEGIPVAWRGRWEARSAVAQWLEAAAAVLEKGRVLLFDYGWTDEEYFAVERPRGTARAYRGHRACENLLVNPGQQDLTAHVRWTPAVRDAVGQGFEVEEFLQQGRWLTRVLAADPWTLDPEEVRQFNTLTHPDIMGEPFRTLVLKKG